MLAKRADWAGKVRLIGLSIDGDSATVKGHVDKKGWNDVEHYHIRRAGCVADKEHGIQGVPHVMLVDTHGKIVYKGHPASRQLEEDIDSLLKDTPITGTGTQPAGKKEAESSDAGTGPESEAVNAAVEKFKAESKKMMDDNSDAFKAFQRAFLVLVKESKYSMSESKWNHKLTCHSVLAGKGELVDIAKPHLEAVNKNDVWKNED